MNIDIIVDNEFCMPTKAHDVDAGFDLVANIESPRKLNPNREMKLGTGVKMNIPKGYCGLLIPRSGLGSSIGMELMNTVGVIDSGYQGEIMVKFTVKKLYNLQPYERFAQIVITPVPEVSLNVVSTFEESERGTGGFGSSGKSTTKKKSSLIDESKLKKGD